MSDRPECEREEIDDLPESVYIEEWKPTLGISILLTFIATVLTVAGVFLFLWIQHVLTGSADLLADTGVEFERTGEAEFVLRFQGVLVLLALAVVVFPLHEWLHGLAFRYYGARPVYGAALFNKILPVLYCAAPGSRFSRGQYAVVILAPVVVISAVGVVLMAITNLGAWLVIPLALNFGGAAGDFWFIGMLLRKEPGTLVEDRKDGLVFYRPVSVPGSGPA